MGGLATGGRVSHNMGETHAREQGEPHRIMAIEHPYLLFLGDAPDQLAAKTA